MFNADPLSSLRQSQIYLSLPYVKMSHYGFKIQDESWSFRRSLPVEKFSKLFNKFRSICSSKIKPPQKSEHCVSSSPLVGSTKKNRVLVHKDPGQAGWREQVWGLPRGLRLQFNECMLGKNSFASVVKVGPRNECSYLCIISPSLVSAVEDLSFPTDPEYFLFFMWRIKIDEIWLKKLLWKGA